MSILANTIIIQKDQLTKNIPPIVSEAQGGEIMQCAQPSSCGEILKSTDDKDLVCYEVENVKQLTITLRKVKSDCPRDVSLKNSEIYSGEALRNAGSLAKFTEEVKSLTTPLGSAT